MVHAMLHSGWLVGCDDSSCIGNSWTEMCVSNVLATVLDGALQNKCMTQTMQTACFLPDSHAYALQTACHCTPECIAKPFLICMQVVTHLAQNQRSTLFGAMVFCWLQPPVRQVSSYFPCFASRLQTECA